MKKWNEQYHDRFKRHSLSRELCDMRNLREAWKRVRANRGSGGVDGESIWSFEEQLEQNLAETQRLLQQRTYEPQPVRRVLIPKPDGRQRPLGIPTIRDRVVQQAVKNLLEPIFEEIFLPCSHGYRPGKDAHQALQKAEAYIQRGYKRVVDADIEGFFDHVDHQILMDLVREKIADGRILDLVEAFLNAGVMVDGAFEESTEGTPQGGVISPLLANIYLNHFDRRMGEEGLLLARYADDFLVFCKTEREAQKALETAKRILECELHLALNPNKTRIVQARTQGVEFLGFRFNGNWRQPKEKAIEKFKESIRHLTRRQQPQNVSMVIKSVNPVMVGWGRYFKGLARSTYRNLDSWIKGRIRCFDAKRRDHFIVRGILQWPELRRLGLVSLLELATQ